MASVKVAVRVRPMNKREINMQSKFIVTMDKNKTTIRNPKYALPKVGDASREALKDFTYDFSFWTVNKTDPKYASQHQVFTCLGLDVVNSAYDGYNACVFAYGQTGSGKTYTMMGEPDDEGLIPRICKELYARMTDDSMTYRCEVSYLEIYNEKVRDLLKHSHEHALRVREHPKEGPYVQDLSKHLVQNYTDIRELMEQGSQLRATASTNMNDTSSRSHAIFTIVFTQAKFSKDAPSETHSKIHLVDLAGSERAGATGATGQRLKEGGSINKSLVTLSKVISQLAERGERRNVFIQYRDSTLTWLLKDSLGGNSKTMMIATISPADVNYGETLSTLRYANHAKNIINKPTVNEDPNVKLIRELREEITHLRALLGGNIDRMVTPKVKEKLHESEARVKVLTEEWANRWDETASLLQEEGGSLALRREGGMGVVLDSELPHLIGIDDNLLSTGIMLYHLKLGSTSIGTTEAGQQQDIVLSGPEVDDEHCMIKYVDNTVTLIPFSDSLCSVNGNLVTEPTQLSQGAVIMLGRTNMFRFNFPEQVAKLRQEYNGSKKLQGSLSMGSLLSQSMTDLYISTDNLSGLGGMTGADMEQAHREQLELLDKKRQEIEALEEQAREAEAARLMELEAKEGELQAARDQLGELRADAERTRHEVQQAHARVQQQEARLRKRSRHVDQTLQRFLNKDGNGDEPAVNVSELRELIQSELQRLAERDTQKELEHQGHIQQLLQEISAMKCAHGERLETISGGMRELQDNEETRKEQLSAAHGELRELSASIASLREQENEWKDKVSALQKLLSRPGDLSSVSARLDTGEVAALRPLLAALNQEKATLKDNDSRLFKVYKNEEERIQREHGVRERDIKERKEKLHTDKVYLTECTEALAEQIQNAATSEEREDLEQDQKVVEDEWQRIDRDEERIKNDENELAQHLKTETDRLQETRDSQVVEINRFREKVKEKERQWTGEVERLIGENRSHMNELLGEATEKESMLISFNQEHEDLVHRQEAEREEDEERRLALEEEKREEEESFRESLRTKEQDVEELHKQQEKFVEETATRKKFLEELLWSDSDDELSEEEVRRRFERWNEYVKKYPDSEGEEEEDSIPEKALLLQKIQKLEDMENQLNQRNQEIEDARQQELDQIDVEKYKLQELEEQGRINTLVEVEVKKRLVEERVQREKRRRMEKDRERQRHDKEMAKIRHSHRREMHRLRQKFESTGNLTQIEENTPTRANPYADVMSGDATPVSGVSRQNSSRTPTNLVRARSLSFVGTPSGDPLIHAAIPNFVMRGGGFDSHVEYELKLTVGEESWTVFRRYSRFRDLHHHLRTKYPEVAVIVFPPKRWFGSKSERVVNERKEQLEAYIVQVLLLLQRNPSYPLHPSKLKLYSKQALWEIHAFFRRGVFENSRSGTG